MAVTVRIPTQLRNLADGAAEVSLDGSTVGEVLGALDGAHAGFGERLFDDGGIVVVTLTCGSIASSVFSPWPVT